MKLETISIPSELEIIVKVQHSVASFKEERYLEVGHRVLLSEQRYVCATWQEEFSRGRIATLRGEEALVREQRHGRIRSIVLHLPRKIFFACFYSFSNNRKLYARRGWGCGKPRWYHCCENKTLPRQDNLKIL